VYVAPISIHKETLPMKTFFAILATTCFALTLSAQTLHGFKVSNIAGEELDLSSYKGKTVLVVNTASKCGLTRQYADLVELQKAYADKGLIVVAFPANNFMNQEPGSNAEIATFCSEKFGVVFPIMSKVSVKGEDIHPLFAFLTTADNPDFKGDIGWNFEKFLIDGEGKLVRRFKSRVNPNGPEVREAVEALVNAKK
jgi:glutathione peroxidase